ncbi:MAG: signal peptidase I [Nitrospinae bacterium]|nr:signal peptidase I [Nitrospinota bacterium]
MEKTEELQKKKHIVVEYFEAIVIALILAFFIREVFVQAYKIPSGSMKDTLLIGDHLLVSKMSYGIKIPNELPFTRTKLFDDIRFFSSIPERFDIIVFKYPEDPSRDFIKRTIGLPGETVEVKNQVVYINGKAIDDSAFVKHIEPPLPLMYSFPRDNFGPVTVPEGHVFMMGDNRENSQDSRYWGFLDVNMIKGKAIILYWSWDDEDSSVRWGRIGNLIH